MAVKPPKCKICGKAEWRHLCAGAPPVLVPPKEKPDPTKAVPGAMTIEDRLDEIESRLDQLETRKKYQREYMREYRK